MFHYARPDQLVVMMYVCGFGGIACFAALLCGFVPSNLKRITATQRARYLWISLAVPIAAAFLYLPLRKYGWSECTGALGEVRQDDFFFGWGITILFYILVVSPVLTFLVGLWIYFVPTMYARRERGSYPTTGLVRLRRAHRRQPPTTPYRSHRP